MRGRIWPRYWTTFRPSAVSTLLRLNSSRRATRESGMAIRPSSGPRNKRSDSPSSRRLSALRGLFPHASIANLGDHVGALRQSQNIQDQRHPAVSHDGRSRESGDAFELFAQRLDDDFLRVIDFVHHQTELAIVRLQNHHVDVLGFEHFFLNRGQQVNDLRRRWVLHARNSCSACA